MIECVEFVATPSQRVRIALSEWLELHGISSALVPIYSRIERDTGLHEIRYDSYVRNGEELSWIRDHRTGDIRPAIVALAHRTDGPPEPFPDVVRYYVRWILDDESA
jgi:hypothetical protein